MTSEGHQETKVHEVGDLVQLKYLSYKDPDYEQLCNFQNSDTLGMVVECFHNYGVVPEDDYYLITVLIDGAKYKSLARNWIKK